MQLNQYPDGRFLEKMVIYWTVFCYAKPYAFLFLFTNSPFRSEMHMDHIKFLLV